MSNGVTATATVVTIIITAAAAATTTIGGHWINRVVHHRPERLLPRKYVSAVSAMSALKPRYGHAPLAGSALSSGPAAPTADTRTHCSWPGSASAIDMRSN